MRTGTVPSERQFRSGQGSPPGRHTGHAAPKTSGIRSELRAPSTHTLPTAETPALRSSRMPHPASDSRQTCRPRASPTAPIHSRTDRLMTPHPQRTSDPTSIADNRDRQVTLKFSPMVVVNSKLQLMSYSPLIVAPSEQLTLPSREGTRGRLEPGALEGGSLRTAAAMCDPPGRSRRRAVQARPVVGDHG